MRNLVEGAVLLLASIFWEALNYWSLLDAVLQKLRASGSAGNLLAGIITSRLLIVVLILVAIRLLTKGIRELGQTKAVQPVTQPLVPPIHIETKVNQSVGPQEPARVTIPQYERPRPNVVFLRTRGVNLTVDGGAGYESFFETNEKGEGKALVACFRNQPLYGVRCADTSVTAQLVFKNATGEEIGIGVSGACWLNQVDFLFHLDVGNSGCVILIVRTNAGQFVVPWKRLQNTGYGNVAATEVFELPEEPKTIEVHLIDGSRQVLREPVVIDLEDVAEDGSLKTKSNPPKDC